MRRWGSWRAGAACAALLAAAGCVSERIEPARDTTLIVVRGSEGVSLSWLSQPGVFYTVLYAPRRDARAEWRPLPGHERIPGTGSTIVRQDSVPAGASRFYRILTEPAR